MLVQVAQNHGLQVVLPDTARDFGSDQYRD